MKIYRKKSIEFRPVVLELLTAKECTFLYALLNGPGPADLEKWLPSNIGILEVSDFKEEICKVMREIYHE